MLSGAPEQKNYEIGMGFKKNTPPPPPPRETSGVISGVIFKEKFAPVHGMQTYRSTRNTPLLILNLGTRLRSVVNFAPWPLYLRVRTPVAIEGTVFRSSILYTCAAFHTNYEN